MNAVKSGEYHTNYATVKARGIDSPVYTVTAHKMPVRKKGYDFASVLKARYNAEENGTFKTDDERFSSSIIRSKNSVLQLAANNPWEYFVTLTLRRDSENFDAYDLNSVKKVLLQFFVNYSRRSGAETNFKYLLIPEKHKDGAWHFHGVLMGINPKDLEINDNGYWDFVPYRERFGHFSLGRKHGKATDEEIRSFSAGNYSECGMGKITDLNKCASYISKYICKEMLGEEAYTPGTHLYFASHGLKRDKVLATGVLVVDPLEFIEAGHASFENEYCTKVKFDDMEVALSCVTPFENEYRLGVNLPVKPLNDDTKKQYMRRAVVKYCNHYGLNPNIVSTESMWNTILEEFSYAINEYDLLKYEHDEANRIHKHMEKLESSIFNGFAYVDIITNESELPFKPEPIFKPGLDYVQESLFEPKAVEPLKDSLIPDNKAPEPLKDSLIPDKSDYRFRLFNEFRYEALRASYIDDDLTDFTRNSIGQRIVCCEYCGHEGLTDDFIEYGGIGEKINYGVCGKCAHEKNIE